jgi:pimeloyl-ACP methyl ester carboxylesterase
MKVEEIGGRKTSPGIGLPVVGWIPDRTASYEKQPFPPPTGISINATALLNFGKGQPTWEFRYPLASRRVRVGGIEQPLAVDWSASQSLYWWMSQMDKVNFSNLLRPARLTREEGIFFGQQLDPDRIPVLFVHGLNSNPHTFAMMVNDLAGQKWFRNNYQVWFYYYPTGVPWLASAEKYRKHLAEAVAYAKQHGVRNLDKMVIVGHSMGGLINSASLRDPGQAVYSTYISKPLGQLDLRPDEREFLRNFLLWYPLPYPTRTIFMSTPHRGSPMADRFFATWMARLIRLPKTLTVDLADAFLRNAASIADPMILNPGERAQRKNIHFVTGIDSLSPRRPIFKVLPNRPFRSGLTLHSIIGDEGKGDTPNSTDGVVPYWSSHIDGVASEKIVPCGHSSTRNPEAIQEVERILRLHLKQCGR